MCRTKMKMFRKCNVFKMQKCHKNMYKAKLYEDFITRHIELSKNEKCLHTIIFVVLYYT